MSLLLMLVCFFILIIAARRPPDPRALQRKLLRAFLAAGASGRAVSARTVGATEPAMRVALGALQARALVLAEGPDAFRVDESGARAALRREYGIALLFWCAILAMPFLMVSLAAR